MAIGGRLMDLLDSHPVPPEKLTIVLEEIKKGFRELLKVHYVEEEGRLSTLSLDEIYALIPPIFEKLSQDPQVLKRLKVEVPKEEQERLPVK
jgi:hypothetical protein